MVLLGLGSSRVFEKLGLLILSSALLIACGSRSSTSVEYPDSAVAAASEPPEQEIPEELLPPNVADELQRELEAAEAEPELPPPPPAITQAWEEDAAAADDEFEERTSNAETEPEQSPALPLSPPPPSLVRYAVGTFNMPAFLVILGMPEALTLLEASGSRSFPYADYPDIAQIQGDLVILNQRLSGTARFWPGRYAGARLGLDAPLPAEWICWLPGRAAIAVEHDAQQQTVRLRAEADHNLASLVKCLAGRIPRVGPFISQAMNLAPREGEHLWAHVVIGFMPAATIRCLDLALLDPSTGMERSLIRYVDGSWTNGLRQGVSREVCDSRDAGAVERFLMP